MIFFIPSVINYYACKMVRI